MNRRGWIGSIVLVLVVLAAGGCLAAWKYAAVREAVAAAANQPEPMESVTAALARAHQYRAETTSIGTVLALQSISLRNELPGTVDTVNLAPGRIVEPGTLLVALDVSVEEAELAAQEAQAALAKTLLDRVEGASQNRAVSEVEVDRARAEHDVALAEIERIKAIIDRKTIRAPFRARVGISDVHPGQYLVEGTLLTTLQGVDEAVHVDFTVAQHVAAGLREGEHVEVITSDERSVLSDERAPIPAEIIAIDARVDPTTRNAMVRAKIEGAPALRAGGLSPGASVRVRVPVGPARDGVLIPVSAVRKGPEGDRVFVIAPDETGNHRARARMVRSGPMFADEIVIVEGLSAGEMVAASGSFKLRDGVLVAIANETAVASVSR